MHNVTRTANIPQFSTPVENSISPEYKKEQGEEI